jgi:uncharacterized protein YbjT (DUF2867 family)
MRVLVLGAYGLIGTHIVSHLLAAGHQVTGLGRDTVRAARRLPEVRWISADLVGLATPDAWKPVLEAADAEAIVNAAGVLQDGARDRVWDVQSRSMLALYQAAAERGVARFVQVSATRADAQASTAFMRSKGDADAALARSDLDWTILRPGLVISPEAYGGTALVRALAATPGVMAIAFGESPVQTVAADDVADAVLQVLEGRVGSRRTYDLVEDVPHTMREVEREVRRWLGFAPAREIGVPPGLVRLVALVADGLGWLGWRSPFRSTAVAEVKAGIRGDASAWREATGKPLKRLRATLSTIPSTVQERWFARAFLAKPMAIGVLAAFWLATGILALAQPQAAKAVLTTRGVGEGLAGLIVVGGALVDMALGAGILVKATAARAALGMILVTLGYLAGGSLVAPDLWLDPLGPLVKAVPAMTPAVVVLALEGDR